MHTAGECAPGRRLHYAPPQRWSVAVYLFFLIGRVLIFHQKSASIRAHSHRQWARTQRTVATTKHASNTGAVMALVFVCLYLCVFIFALVLFCLSAYLCFVFSFCSDLRCAVWRCSRSTSALHSSTSAFSAH